MIPEQNMHNTHDVTDMDVSIKGKAPIIILPFKHEFKLYGKRDYLKICLTTEIKLHWTGMQKSSKKPLVSLIDFGNLKINS